MTEPSWPPPQSNLQNHTVLIVDDNLTNLSVLSHSLEQQGLRLLIAQTGEMALKRAQLAHPDLILLDIMLPDIAGFEVCQRLKTQPVTCDIPIIFMTALTETEAKMKGFQAGGVDYITKPFQSEEVLARVQTHLALRLAQKQLEAQNTQLQQEITERKRAEQMLRESYTELERRVLERTIELTQANLALQEQINERQRGESDLLTERNLLRTLIDNLPDFVYTKDRQHRFMITNTAHMTFLGADTLDQVLNKTDFDFYPAELAVRFQADEETVMESGRALVNKEENLTKIDKPNFTLTTKVPLRDSQGRVTGLVGIGRNITEWKQLEEQFIQAQKMESVGRLAGGIAHDFNNLLMVIMGNTQLVYQAVQPNAAVGKDLETILEAAERAKNLTRQLLTFARKQILSPQTLNLNDLILNLDKLLRRVIGEDIELSMLPAANLWSVKADANQMEQVLINMAVNARDAMPNGGTLTLETANITLDEAYTRRHVEVKPGPYVMVAVNDTGAGMSPEVQSRLFEPFFTTKEAGKGTGLGLATCYGIIKQHGGNIWVYSEVGRGTTFRVYLPALAEPPRSSLAAPAASATPLRGNETILLVEDDETVRQFTLRVLKLMGYSVIEASDGIEALQLAAGYPGIIHLLLTDVVMPKMSGRVLAQQLQATHPQTRVLYMSGYTANAIVHNGMLDPDINFLPKPILPEQLARKIREVLSTSS